MKLEWLLFLAGLGVALWPLVRMPRGWRLLMLGATLLLAALAATGARLRHASLLQVVQADARQKQKVPREGRPGGYVSSAQCQSCHPGQYSSWHHSYHRTMTQYASRDTVPADFRDVKLELDGKSYRLQQRDKELWVEMDDVDWPALTPRQRQNFGLDPVNPSRSWHRIGLATGSHYFQAYWVASRAGNLQVGFPFAWLVEDQRWVPRKDSFLMDPELPWQDQLWNANCIRCHATAGQPRFPESTRIADTRAAEMGISCESCHGPGEAHVKANQNPVRRYQVRRNNSGDPTIVNPSRLKPEASAQVCGQCHSVRYLLDQPQWKNDGFRYLPGQDLSKSDAYLVRYNQLTTAPEVPEPLRDPMALKEIFWPDGVLRVTGREFTGLIESGCYQKGGMSCLNCHSMHQGTRNNQMSDKGMTSQACATCHVKQASPTHTHHTANSTGSQCYNCHMPYHTYGLLRAVRTHHITSPSLANNRSTGRPNACNLCHLDKPLAWTARHLKEWYGQESPDVTQTEQSVAAGVLWALTGDASVRAITAYAMGWKPARQPSGHRWMTPFLLQLMDDSYSAVRYVAHKALRNLPGFEGAQFDYVGAAPARAQALQKLLDQWKLNPALDRAGDAFLLNPDGSMQEPRRAELFKQRDNTPMFLVE